MSSAPWLLALAIVAGAGEPPARVPPPLRSMPEPRLDHRDQLGVLVVPEGERLFGPGADSDRLGAGLSLGVSLPLSDEGIEGVLTLHGLDAAPGELQPRVTLGGALRRFAGDDAWKSFFEAGLRLPIVPAPGARLRLGLGVQWDLTPGFGAWLGGGAGAGLVTEGFVFGLDAGLGLQWRFASGS